MYSDSDDSGDESNDRGDEDYNSGINLTSILFGNIDNNGELVDDILDEESRKHLGVLSKFGLNSILNEVIEKENPTQTNLDAEDEELDKEVKNSIAVDYSDFNELADETDAADGESSGNTNDKALMPPPLKLPLRNTSYFENGMELTPPVEPKKLETPLAAMLPSKYANVDVRELFPDFRPDKVLRFSRLFGPGKPTSLPQIWRGVKKRKKKKKKDRDVTQILNNVGSDSTSDSEEPRRRGFDLYFGPEAQKEQCASDDEDKLLKIVTDEDKKEIGQENANKNDNKPNVADWRYGPAQIWYDILEVPDSGEGFNYGFKTKEKEKEETPKIETEVRGEPIADDAYLLVSQLHWEDDVVWDGNDIKAKVLQKLNSKTNAAGWLPSSGSRTAVAFSQPGKGPVSATSGTGKLPAGQGKQKNQIIQKQEEVDDTWYSIFPVENEELIYGKWEDEIIWDAEDMPKIPKPKILTLDPNDENIILGIPDDIDPSKINKNLGPPPKVKIPHPHVKKSKILLGKAGVINVLAEDTPPPPPKSPDRDPYNISNDNFYMPKTEPTLKLKVGGGNLIQHSTPVVELRSPFVPTYMGPMKLRNFHRPALKKYSHGTLAQPLHHSVQPLLKHIAKKAKQREAERIAAGGGDVFFMRNHDDLSGKDGDIILAEFCEEHPPLMNQVGMCSKIKNYYKRKAAKDNGPTEYPYGEVAYAHTSPFLGILQPGMCIQALENNMYRAPIYQQSVNPTDFLIIRTRNNYWVREINALYVVGQECPLYEVPGPNSKRANNFTRDFLQVFIYRLFWKSKDTPRRIRMDDIKKAFPAHSESSIRKRLKQCADFKRTGMDSNWWVIKPEFRLPSEEEIRAMVSPEQCCSYFSMIAAEQRLKDAGYGEKSLFAPQEDDDEETQLKMDDEVKVAPWNTTRAYIQAMRGKCLLQLTGPADPTGCGEGFSYVRVPNKPTQTKEEQESQPKRTVTGTDADLRRLPLNKAKELLRKFKVPDDEIKKLTRWEVIDVVRTLSTEKAKAGEQGMDKFSRGNRFSIAEHQERYKEECQRIFDLQNKVLASEEVLSTDEDESSASEESDLEEMGKNLENMLSNKKTSTQLSLEREEQERQELLKVLHEGGSSNAGNGTKKKEDNGVNPPGNQRRILKITRTFKNQEGKEYTRVETVRKQQIIDAYVKIRTTKDDNFIKQFATLDDQQKEEMKREKRRIQEQLRRIKRNQERERLAQLAAQQKSAPGGMPTSLGDPKSSGGSGPMHGHHHNNKDTSPSRRKFKLKPDLKLKCGACGQVGHMRTNKACPLYTGSMGGGNGSNYAGSIHENPSPTPPPAPPEPEEEQEKMYEEDFEDLVNVDGTKVTMSSKLLKHHEDIKKRKMLKEARKRRRMGLDMHCDYLQRQKTANRRRTDPVVTLSSILEEILNDLRDMPDVTPFMFPVNAKKVPDYHRIIQRPMDLQSIRENLRQKKYQSREEFLADVNQIVENSNIYNGQSSSLSAVAQRMLQKCVGGLAEREDRLIKLEKAINPLLDDNDQVALSFIFEKIVNNNLKTMPESYPFLKPVNKKQVKDYYTIIKKPMDFETISKKVSAHKYHSRSEFLADIELIASNCEQYNGSEADYTKNAKTILQYANFALSEFNDHCQQLEENIARVQEKAREDANFDDSWDHSDGEHDMSHRYGRYSRSTTPEFDLDLDEFRPPSRGGSKPSTSSDNPGQPNQPEVKRGRGRPRKNPLPEDGPPKIPGVKRGRGRPRKDSNIANMNSSQQNSFLEEDLQYSESDNEDYDDKDDIKQHLLQSDPGSTQQGNMSMEGSNMMLDMQNSQDMSQNQFKYDQQNMMESIPEEYENYKDEQNQQYSMMANEGQQHQLYQQDLLPQYQQYSGEMKMDPSIEDDSFDPSDFLGLPNDQSAMKMGQMNQNQIEQSGMENAHFMPPPPVSNMSDLSQNDTFKQDLLQTAMELDQNDDQMLMQQNQQQLQQQQHEFQQQQEYQQQEFQQQQAFHQQNVQAQEPQMLMSDHMSSNPMGVSGKTMGADIHDDLAISDSDEDDGRSNLQSHQPPLAMKTQENDDDDGGLWF